MSQIPFIIEPLMFRALVLLLQYAICVCTSISRCVLLLTIPKFTPTYSLEVIILASFATRMHLHLWQTNRRPCNSHDPVPITTVIYEFRSMCYSVAYLVSSVERGLDCTR
ncbi:hypothetical protein BDR04DRAFT_786953 [Suillus decipiens]|nr:hypothetical protein BDR04DRAFT_786953 [Suillus decipiens]